VGRHGCRLQRKLRYLLQYTPGQRGERQQEISELEEDVRFVYSYVAKEDRMKSYTRIALERAIGHKRQDFAVSALRSQDELAALSSVSGSL
jgi:hypothetical protein